MALAAGAWAPLQWAETETNLGNALLALGKRESGVARLEAAAAAYNAASEVFVAAGVDYYINDCRNKRDRAQALLAEGKG